MVQLNDLTKQTNNNNNNQSSNLTSANLGHCNSYQLQQQQHHFNNNLLVAAAETAMTLRPSESMIDFCYKSSIHFLNRFPFYQI